MQPGNVLMRVKEGKRPLPYNDGQTLGEHKPGEVFEGPAKFLTEFRDHVEQVGEDGAVVAPELSEMVTPGGVPLQAMRAHEQAGELRALIERRKAEQAAEIAALEAQAAKAEQKAEREAAERNKRREVLAAAERELQEAQGGPQPAAGEASEAQAGQRPARRLKDAAAASKAASEESAGNAPETEFRQG